MVDCLAMKRAGIMILLSSHSLDAMRAASRDPWRGVIPMISAKHALFTTLAHELGEQHKMKLILYKKL